MLREERFTNIIEFLKVNGTAKINEIAKLNHVSVDTVRRDLETLEGYGVLTRVRGGAVSRNENLERHVYEMRLNVHSREKTELAKLAADIVSEGQTVAMGSGSTTVEIAKFMAVNYNRLIIITNDLDIVRIFSHKEDFRIIIPGGLIDIEENAVYGERCEEELSKYNADVGILSVNSVSLEKGLSDFRLNQVDVFRKMMEISQKIVIAADSSKFGKPACMTICGMENVDVILSDGSISDEKVREYAAAGIVVLRPEKTA